MWGVRVARMPLQQDVYAGEPMRCRARPNMDDVWRRSWKKIVAVTIYNKLERSRKDVYND